MTAGTKTETSRGLRELRGWSPYPSAVSRVYAEKCGS